MWVRGLKLVHTRCWPWPCKVAPRVGAWIETSLSHLCFYQFVVAPRVGAWIETYVVPSGYQRVIGRTPCGCVD